MTTAPVSRLSGRLDQIDDNRRNCSGDVGDGHEDGDGDDGGDGYDLTLVMVWLVNGFNPQVPIFHGQTVDHYPQVALIQVPPWPKC